MTHIGYRVQCRAERIKQREHVNMTLGKSTAEMHGLASDWNLNLSSSLDFFVPQCKMRIIKISILVYGS